MPIIEFIGPPGVGKSTLAMQLASIQPRRNWLLGEEFLRGLGPRKMPRERVTVFDEALLDWKLDRVVAEKVEAGSRTALQRFELLSYFLKCLMADVEMRQRLEEANVVTHEGFFKNFADGIVALRQAYPDELARLLALRAFVVFRATPERIAASLRKRAEGLPAGALNRFDHYGDDALLTGVQERIDRVDAIIAMARQCGCPMLVMDLAVGEWGDRERVRSFLDEVFGRNSEALKTR